MKHTHTLQIRPGLSATMTIDAEAMQAGRVDFCAVVWVGRPTVADIPPYRDWALGIQQDAVDRTGKTAIYALHPDEIYILKPGQPRQKTTLAEMASQDL